MKKLLLLFLSLAPLGQTQSTTISPVVFSGSGINDATSGGVFTALPTNATYVVTISATGTPDHFTWTLNGGAASSPAALTGAMQTLSNGVTIKFAATTGHTLNDSWTILVAARSSSAGVNYISGGNSARMRNTQSKQRETVSVTDYGAVGDGSATSSSGTDNCNSFKAAAAVSGNIEVPPGIYFTSCSITMPLTSHYIGRGRGDSCATAKTCIVFAAGVSGFVNSTTSRGSSIVNLWIHSLSTVSGTDDGIEPGDSWLRLINLGISGFGRAGIYNTTNNVDNMHFEQLLLVSNKGDGYYCSNADCNNITGVNSEALNNGASPGVNPGQTGIGWHMGSGAENVFTALKGTGNVVGDFDDGGLGGHWISPSCESGTGATFTERGTYNHITASNGAACAISLVGGSSATNRIDYFESSSLQIVQNGAFFGAIDPQASGPVSYAWLSGNDGTGCASLRDLTNNVLVMKYCASGNTITFNQSVVFSIPTPNQTFTQTGSGPGLTLYKADNTGAGAPSFITHWDGTNASSTEVSYGAIQTAIDDNTAGAHGGSLHFQTARPASSGALADVLILNDDGSASIPGSLKVAGVSVVTGSGFTGAKTRTVCTTISGGVPTGCSNVTENYLNGLLQ